MQRQESQLYQQLRAIKARRDTLQDEANEALPVGVQALQQELESAEEEQRSIMTQFGEVARQRETIHLAMKPVQAELNGIKQQIKDFQDRKQAFMVSSAPS